MAAHRLQVENLSFAYGETAVLRGVSFTVRPGAVTTLMGANACGKTTLLLVMTKNLKPDAGRVLLDGRDIAALRLRDFARRAAVVHQKNTAPDDLSVEQLVFYGRTPYGSPFRGRSAEDETRVALAMAATGITDIARQPMGTLSGGQRQRAFIAMALAQDTKLLFLDEPTTFLDIRYQVETLRLIRALNAERGITILMVLHDINQAALYSDEVIALKDGAVLTQGPPREVITEETVFAVYGVRLPVRADGERIWVLPA
ncbi:MAG: ABC transporter ATP-binding protein [Gracilibacteraceae bacterium]|nr:ABC transporter ATP-binding protein [Gracilibacteraceae bacterium]